MARPLTRLAALAVLVGGLAAPAAAQPVAAAPAASAHAPGVCTAPGDPEKPQPGDTSALHEIDSSGGERSYVLRLPRGYEQRDDWPLVLAYHGRGSSGAEVEGYSELSRLPAVVAYPNGATIPGGDPRRAWQGAPYAPEGVDDVAFTADLLDELSAAYCVDETRVHATGKSNGGGLVALLACRMPDRIASVAPVAAAHYPDTRESCDDAPAVPVLSVHGTADATIPYDGDPDRDLPAVRDQATTWALRAGCARTPVERRTAPDVLTSRWRACEGGVEVRHVAVEGGGHVWPGSDVYSGGGHTTHSIETSRLVWRFFGRHQLDPTDQQEAAR